MVTKIKVIDKLTRKSSGFCSIETKDSLGHTINGFEIDYSGIIELKLEQEYKLVEVSCLGYANQKIDCESMDRFNYLVEMEEMKVGGRVAGDCLVYYIDVLLEFKIDNQSNLMSFERHGRVFKKVQKLSNNEE